MERVLEHGPLPRVFRLTSLVPVLPILVEYRPTVPNLTNVLAR